jgi:hypothetical protein
MYIATSKCTVNSHCLLELQLLQPLPHLSKSYWANGVEELITADMFGASFGEYLPRRVQVSRLPPFRGRVGHPSFVCRMVRRMRGPPAFAALESSSKVEANQRVYEFLSFLVTEVHFGDGISPIYLNINAVAHAFVSGRVHLTQSSVAKGPPEFGGSPQVAMGVDGYTGDRSCSVRASGDTTNAGGLGRQNQVRSNVGSPRGADKKRRRDPSLGIPSREKGSTSSGMTAIFLPNTIPVIGLQNITAYIPKNIALL